MQQNKPNKPMISKLKTQSPGKPGKPKTSSRFTALLAATALLPVSMAYGATYFSENFDTLTTAGLTNAGWDINHNGFAFETGTDFVLARWPYDALGYENTVWPPGNSGPPGTSFFDPVTATPLVTPPGEDGRATSTTSGGYFISDSDAAGGSDNIGSLSEFWAATPSFSTIGATEVWWHADADIEANNNGECIVTLDVSVDGGTTWIQAWAQAEPQRPIKAYNWALGDPTYEGGAPIGGYPVLGSYSQTKTWSGIHGRWHVKLPAAANNQANVKVRIRYLEPADAWWIALDNIVIDNNPPPQGSQVVLLEQFESGIPATWKNLSSPQKWGSGPLTNLDGTLKMTVNATDTREVNVDLLRYVNTLRAAGTNLPPANVLNWSVTNFVDYPDLLGYHPNAPIDGYYMYMMAGGNYAMWQPDDVYSVSELDSPTLNLSDKSAVYLDFDSEWLNRIYNAADPTLSQNYLVQVSVDGGTTFTNIFDYQAALSNIGEAGYYMHHYIPVPIAAGKSSVVFRFRAEGLDTGNSGTRHQGFWVIDNVRVTANQARLITDVVEAGGDAEPTDTITAKWTGQIFPVSVANEPLPGLVVGNNYEVGSFGNGAPAFVDRNHTYTNASGTVLIPSYLAGGEYIMSGNDNRDNTNLTMQVFVAKPVQAYLLIDNRLNDGDNATPPTFTSTNMQWVVDEGWTAVRTGNNRTGNPNVADEVGIDEGSDGSINQWYSIYTKAFPAGSFQLKQADNAGRNMYGTVITLQPPRVTITQQGANVVITFPTGYRLQRASAVTGPWTDVVGTSPVTEPATANQQYYRGISP
jgi:hypothetical protein